MKQSSSASKPSVENVSSNQEQSQTKQPRFTTATQQHDPNVPGDMVHSPAPLRSPLEAEEAQPLNVPAIVVTSPPPAGETAKILYFAYGKDMDVTYLTKKVGNDVKAKGIGKLAGYRLIIDSSYSFPKIVPDEEGHSVFGVVWQLLPEDMVTIHAKAAKRGLEIEEREVEVYQSAGYFVEMDLQSPLVRKENVSLMVGQFLPVDSLEDGEVRVLQDGKRKKMNAGLLWGSYLGIPDTWKEGMKKYVDSPNTMTESGYWSGTMYQGGIKSEGVWTGKGSLKNEKKERASERLGKGRGKAVSTPQKKMATGKGEREDSLESGTSSGGSDNGEGPSRKREADDNDDEDDARGERRIKRQRRLEKELAIDMTPQSKRKSTASSPQGDDDESDDEDDTMADMGTPTKTDPKEKKEPERKMVDGEWRVKRGAAWVRESKLGSNAKKRSKRSRHHRG